MDNSTIFSLVNTLVLPFWVLLLFFPNWKFRNPSIYIGVAILASLYAFYLVTGPRLDVSSFGSLEGVQGLFQSEKAILIGWIHYLAFDLMVGNWIVNEAKKLNIKHIWLIPCLLFCFMLGPVGFLLFQILKYANIGRVN